MSIASKPQQNTKTSGGGQALTVAIVGATGAVGQEFLKVLGERQFPIGELKLLASARSAGKTAEFNGQTYTLEELTEHSFEGVDLALFSAGGSISEHYAPLAVKAGATVVDNSSAFRMAEGVPLVVPEVNADAIGEAGIKLGEKPGIIANPNCSTIIMVVPTWPLHKKAGIQRMIVSTYQAASGAGAAAMAELEQQTRDVLEGREPTKAVFDRQYAFNLFSHDSTVGEAGYNKEEQKMLAETRKIFGLSDDSAMGVTATCIRVPVMRAHAESINLTFQTPLSEDEARQVLSEAPGVSIMDDREANQFPTPLDATGTDDVFVGRIRRDLSQPEGYGLDLFVCGDQIRKGAALNAVQIAEQLV
jgi:aspartate-semialdehyde dehydrogenase